MHRLTALLLTLALLCAPWGVLAQDELPPRLVFVENESGYTAAASEAYERAKTNRNNPADYSGYQRYGLQMDQFSLHVPGEINGKPVTSIAENAFHLEQATLISLPATITQIGQNAFRGAKVQSLTLPEGLETIGAYAFDAGSALEELALPASVVLIDDYTFGWRPAPKLIVERGSYAEQFVRQRGMHHAYPDADDWLSE